MKETKEEVAISTIPVDQLVKGQVYWNDKHNLVQIKNIDHSRQEMYLYNMTEQFSFNTDFSKHTLIKKVR